MLFTRIDTFIERLREEAILAGSSRGLQLGSKQTAERRNHRPRLRSAITSKLAQSDADSGNDVCDENPERLEI